jgi:starch-binding outer membrane protein, SusD/RagB family
MTRTMPRRGPIRRAATACLLLVVALAGCSLTEVSDPTKIEEPDVSNATGADLLRRNALRRFYDAAALAALWGGLVGDEFVLVPVDPLVIHVQLDQRLSDASRAEELADFTGHNLYTSWHQVRHAATLARARLAANAPPSHRAAHMGQMLAVRGYATLSLGEQFCPGFPLHELDGYTPVYGAPLTTEQVFTRALADLDSAVVLAADSARILDFARVGRGRALLGLGRAAEAATAVADVPTSFAWNGEYAGNLLFFSGTTTGNSVADQEGGTGLDFVSAADPRLPMTQYGTAADGRPLYRANKYSSHAAPIVLASGIEARLIEAEAALAGGGDWLGILNALRATQVTPAMPPLVDPGTVDAQVDLLFRERAFWLFGTSQRLSDLRRLMRQYHRGSETVFPTGAGYGTLTSLPFPAELEQPFSPGVTGCIGP